MIAKESVNQEEDNNEDEEDDPKEKIKREIDNIKSLIVMYKANGIKALHEIINM